MASYRLRVGGIAISLLALLYLLVPEHPPSPSAPARNRDASSARKEPRTPAGPHRRPPPSLHVHVPGLAAAAWPGTADPGDILRQLREFAAAPGASPEAIVYGKGDLLRSLAALGRDALPTLCLELQQPGSPLPLRVLLVETAASMAGGPDPALAATLMALSADTRESNALRLQALQWIPEAGSPEDGRMLLERLADATDPAFEFALTRAAGGFTLPESVPLLETMLHRDGNGLTPVAAVRALLRQDPELAGPVLQEALAEAASEETPGLERSITVMHLALAAGERQDRDSIGALAALLLDPEGDVSVRSAAAESLGRIGTPDSLAILRKTLEEEPDESVLVYTARSLADCGDEQDARRLKMKANEVTDDYLRVVMNNAADHLQRKQAP